MFDTVKQFAVLAVNKLPCRVAEPGEGSAVVVAFGALVALAAAHMVTVDVAVCKLIQQLMGKSGLGAEDDVGILF